MADIVEEVGKLKDILYAGRPSYLIISSALADFYPDRIVVTEDVDSAGTDSKYLYINPRYWSALTTEEKIFVLAHEMLHYIFGDPEYIKSWGVNTLLWNLATDCVINRELLRDLRVSSGFRESIVTPAFLAELAELIGLILDLPESKIKSEGWFATATKQEIYYYLKWLFDRLPKPKIEEIGSKIADKKLTGDVKPSPYSRGEAEDRERRFRAENERIKRYFKEAGRGVGGLLDRVLTAEEPKIDWRDVLSDVIAEVAEEYISTWRRPSRRHEEYPGYVRYGMPGVVALIDISGSIGSKDLSVFMSEIKSMMEEYGVEYVAVIYWHERVERVEELTDVSDVEEEVEVLSSFPSGGTRLVPALRKALEFSGDDRVVVVFTDGVLGDDNSELRSVSEEVANSFARACLVYTVEVPENLSPSWDTVRYPLS